MSHLESLRFGVDAWWTFVLPAMTVVSLLANLFNIFVLRKLRHDNACYKFLHAKAIVNTAYLLTCFWKFVVKCGQFCPPSPEEHKWKSTLRRLLIDVYNFYGYNITASMLGHCDLMLEIGICVERARLIFKKRYVKMSELTAQRRPTPPFGRITANWVIATVVGISLALYVPAYTFAHFELVRDTDWSIESGSNESLVLKTEAESTSARRFPIVFKVNAEWHHNFDVVTTIYLRSALMLLLIVSINVINCCQLNHKVRRVQRMRGPNTGAPIYQGSQRMSRTRTLFNRMLLMQSLLYVLGNNGSIVAYAILYMMEGGMSNPYFPLLPPMVNTMLIASIGLNSLVYLVFDVNFRETAREIIIKQTESTFS